MVEVFISYKREQRAIAKQVADAVAARGYTVWWDVELLPGDAFWDEIETILDRAKAAIVLWSEAAKASDAVKAEAHHALDREIYIGASLEPGCLPPLRFKPSQFADLSGLPADETQLAALLAGLEKRIGPPSAAPAPEAAPSDFEPEAAFWRAIRDDPTADELRSYLRGFGEDGAFADLAQERLAALTPPPAAPPPRAAAEPARRPAAKPASAPKPPAPPREPPRATPQPEIFRDRLTLKLKPSFVGRLRGESEREIEGPELVSIPGGRFLMGAPEDEPGRRDWEGPQHEVTVPPFALGRTPVAFDDYDAFCAATGASKPSDEGWGRGRRPAINVSWKDAQAYCAWLSEQTGAAYRLPSEAEWEYACRAGTTTRYAFGDDEGALDRHAWFSSNSGGQTQPVGGKPANPFGLHDMHGNVEEWVQDCWNGHYRGAPTDGSVWMSGDCFAAVLRGGSWLNVPWDLRSAIRDWNARVIRYDSIGFRVARVSRTLRE